MLLKPLGQACLQDRHRLGEYLGRVVLKVIPFNMGNRQKHGLFEKNRGRELRKTEPDCKKPRKIGHSCMLRGLVLKVQPAVAQRPDHEAETLLVSYLDIGPPSDLLGDRREYRLTDE